MSSPDLTEAERAAVLRVLSTASLSLGPQLEAFEKAAASFVGASHAVAVNSGTSGLHLCVIGAGVGEGDLVITSPFSFVASANCVLYERGVPIFVDVEPTTGNIDPVLVGQATEDLTSGGAAARRWLPLSLRDAGAPIGSLKALLPVHAFGQPANMDFIAKLARRHRLELIEDACEALGAEYRGHQVGTLGNVAVFGFYPNKQITTGEGGLIVTDDADRAALFSSLRNQGRDVPGPWLVHSRLGYNYRLDEMSAALGLVQLGRIETLLARRARVAEWYRERLVDLELVRLPTIATGTTRMSWFVYVVRIMPPASRDHVMRSLGRIGVPSRPYFSPIHLQPFYRARFGYKPGDFPVTEQLAAVSLALPFSSVMSEEQVDQVSSELRRAVRSPLP